MSSAHVKIVSMDGQPTEGREWITTDDGRHIPIEPINDITELAETCLANSERWFPTNHTSFQKAVTHCTLGLAGEAGEVANKVKKYFGYLDQQKLAGDQAGQTDAIIEELVDTLIYDLVLLVLMGADIPTAIARKVAICEARWGS